jgi:hypothetical protein
MDIRNLDTGEVQSTPDPIRPAPRQDAATAVRPSRLSDPTFVETADVVSLYTSETASPRPVSVPPVYVRPERPVHVGMAPDAALRAAGIVALCLIAFFVAVYFIGTAVTPR